MKTVKQRNLYVNDSVKVIKTITNVKDRYLVTNVVKKATFRNSVLKIQKTMVSTSIYSFCVKRGYETDNCKKKYWKTQKFKYLQVIRVPTVRWQDWLEMNGIEDTGTDIALIPQGPVYKFQNKIYRCYTVNNGDFIFQRIR